MFSDCTLIKSVEFYYTLPSTPVWSYQSSTEVWSLVIKVWSFFIPHSVCTITAHFLCDYKLSNCLPTCLSYSPFECLPACRSDCLSLCLWVCPSGCLSVCLYVCQSACLSCCLPVLSVYIFVLQLVSLSVCLSVSSCLHVCLFVFQPACLYA